MKAYLRNGRTIVLDGAFSEIDFIRGVPNRAWSDKLREWTAPLTPGAVTYLLQYGIDFRPELEALMAPRHVPAGYAFKTAPRAHQATAIGRGLGKAAFGHLMDPGLGKTHTMINEVGIAQAEGTIEGAAVVCPNSIRSNWEDEIALHSNMPADIFSYDPSKKKQGTKWLAAPKKGFPWFICSTETLSSGDGKKYLQAFLEKYPSAFLLDESCWFKDPDASRTKVILELGPLAKMRRIATGTAFASGLIDAWAQFTFLDPGILRMNYYAFRNRFCVMGDAPVKRLPGETDEEYARRKKPKRIVGYRNVQDFIDLVSPYVFVGRKEECLDLPPKVYQVRKVQPTAEQVRLYRELRSEGRAELNGKAVVATNVLVRNLRLQQITSGFAALTDDSPAEGDVEDMLAALERGGDVAMEPLEGVETVPIPGGNPKITELINMLDEFPGKMIIWCRFRPEIEAIAQALEPYGEVLQFHGDVDTDTRAERRRRFQTDPEARFFVAQIRTGGVGITLTAATTVVYFSNDWSVRSRIQSEDRSHRIGTTGTVTYVDLVWERGAVDAQIRNALMAGTDFFKALIQRVDNNTQMEDF